MPKKKIRVAFIGCGDNMRLGHLPPIHSDPRVELAAVADPNPAQMALLFEKNGGEVPAYTDYREMLASETLDAVVISTPHSLHYAQAGDALRRGLHVLIEKPLTITSRDARALIGLAEKRDRMLVVAYQRMFQPPFVHARDLIARGEIGEITGVACYMTQDWGALGGWRADPAMAGGGMLMDSGSHLLSATLHVSGLRPREVRAWTDNAGMKVDRVALLQVAFTNGAMGTFATLGRSKKHDERISIHGDKGCIVLDSYAWRLRGATLNHEPMIVPEKIKPQSPDHAFYRWIENGGRGYTPPQIAFDTARLKEAAYRSAASGQPVKMRA